MKKFSSYIFKQLSFTSFMIAMVLTGTLWIVQSLKFFDLVLKSQESFYSFFLLMLFALPDLLVLIVPLACFMSVIFVYYRLNSDRELIVLSACGVSPWRLASPALKFGLAATVCIYAINISILPWSFQKMRDVEYQLKRALPGILLQEKVFNTFNDITIYVHEKKGQDLKGILAYIQKNNETPLTFLAKEGKLVLVDQQPKIVMVDGSRQEFNAQTNALSVLYFDQTVVSLFEGQLTQAARPKKPYELGLFELLNPEFVVKFAHKQRLYAEGYQRLLTPWYSFVFILIALTFLLLTPFRRKAQVSIIIKSICGALALQVTCVSLINIGAHHWEAIGGAFILIISTISICLWYLREKKS